MRIRQTTPEDMPTVLDIYAYAREQMKSNGNPTQWGNNRPSVRVIQQDIKQKVGYAIEENNQIHAVFSFILGEDSTYQNIEAGSWLNDEPYGTLHRVASDGSKRGVLKEILNFCESKINNIRVDTHENNIVVQKILKQCGYIYCGVIYVDDGTPRLAYHKSL
ncbi:N-acetyltransferase [Neisseriaceae bacterium PsAf]|nr:N-acetyltransferase [Neisseriaceae bacterium PsAf]MCV2503021.1 hypothetical protein [Neisseriaceae bacterium]